MRTKYGTVISQKIINQKSWLGMSAEMARKSGESLIQKINQWEVLDYTNNGYIKIITFILKMVFLIVGRNQNKINISDKVLNDI